MRVLHILSIVIVGILVGAVASADISAWFVPSAQKIMRDAKPAPAAKWDLACAQNECESCQVVLLSDQPVTGAKVTVSDLVHAKDQGRLKAELFKVEYVPIHADKALYPDPLVPLTGSFDLAANQAQPVWILVRTTKDTPAGTYNGTVTVTVGKWKKQLPLSVKVWNFALPVTPSGQTAFGIDYHAAAQYQGIELDSVAGRKLAIKYYEYILDHRLSPYSFPVDIMSKAAVPYLNDPRMTSYVIPYIEDDTQQKALIAHLIEGNWFKKGFFYPIDEPSSKAVYDSYTKITDRLRNLEPRYRLTTPFWANPDFDGLTTADVQIGRVTNWCPHLLYVGGQPNFRQFLKARKNAGDTIWWYVCNNPRGDYNNLQIDDSGMASRVLLWQQRREGIEGLLYWHVNYWTKQFTPDPWLDMNTIGTGFWGDGSLLYPGAKVGVDGPVGTVRLEILRDGMEDYDYLTLSDQLLGPDITMGYITRIARTLTDFERDPVKLEVVRRELGDAIEKAIKESRERQ